MSTMRVYVIVIVASFEPESIITKSIENLRELECDDFDLKVCYVIDTFEGDKRKLHWALPDNFTVMLRAPKGHKAGAINDALRMIKTADYVAIIDVDWRPAKDFITKCIARLERDDSAVHASGCRFGVNLSNTLTKIISNDLGFITCDVYGPLIARPSGFMVGTIGVMKWSFLNDEKFNEETCTEDIDFYYRICITGKVAVLADTSIGEHVPATLKELYHQRVRWYRGGVETVSKNLITMVKAPIPFARKMWWVCQVMLIYCAFLFTPLVISNLFLHLDRIKRLSDSPLEFVKIFYGSLLMYPFMTVCGLVAIVKHLTSSEFEWKPTTRADAETGKGCT